MYARKNAFTLIELMVVIAVIVLVSGMTIPMMTQFFDRQKLPRAAKVLATYMRDAQVNAVNYMMVTQLELTPGTNDELRTWAYSAVINHPTSSLGILSDWDRVDQEYILATEGRRMRKSGGKIRLLPLNPFSKEPQNAELFGERGDSAWEFAELRYTHTALKSYDRTSGYTELAFALCGVSFANGDPRDNPTCKIGIDTPVGIQVLLGEPNSLPQGVGIDPVNYVDYDDRNKDGMPDGNPMALYIDIENGQMSPVEPLIVSGGGISDDDLFEDVDIFKPNKISGSLMFNKEGTLKRNFSLRYNAKNPDNLITENFLSALGTTAEAIIYGMILYDKASPNKRMAVEVTGVGQVRRPYSVYPLNNTNWGE